jgi:hypothetical protein
MKMAAFWDVAQCILADIHRRFRRAYYLHHGDEWVSSSETSVNIYQTTMRNIPADSYLHKLILFETVAMFNMVPNSYSLRSADICIQFAPTTINGVQEVRVLFYMHVFSARGRQYSTLQYLAVTMQGAQLLDRTASHCWAIMRRRSGTSVCVCVCVCEYSVCCIFCCEACGPRHV